MARSGHNSAEQDDKSLRWTRAERAAILTTLLLTLIGTCSAVESAEQARRQADASIKQLETAAKLELFQTRVEQFKTYAEESYNLDSDIRRALFVSPINLHSADAIRVAPQSLIVETSNKLGFVTTTYETFLARTNVATVGWSASTAIMIAASQRAAQDAAQCFLVIGPGGRTESTAEYWINLRTQLLNICPATAAAVLHYVNTRNKALEQMKKEVEALGIAQANNVTTEIVLPRP